MTDDNLEGIRPEDLPRASDLVRSPEELAAVAESVVRKSEEPIDLHDSEIPRALMLLQYFNDKYSGETDTAANLDSFRKEAIEKFAQIGLEVLVDVIHPDRPPTITVVGRTTPFDPDRQRFDVRSGVADEYWDRKRQQGRGA